MHSGVFASIHYTYSCIRTLNTQFKLDGNRCNLSTATIWRLFRFSGAGGATRSVSLLTTFWAASTRGVVVFDAGRDADGTIDARGEDCADDVEPDVPREGNTNLSMCEIVDVISWLTFSSVHSPPAAAVAGGVLNARSDANLGCAGGSMGKELVLMLSPSWSLLRTAGSGTLLRKVSTKDTPRKSRVGDLLAYVRSSAASTSPDGPDTGTFVQRRVFCGPLIPWHFVLTRHCAQALFHTPVLF